MIKISRNREIKPIMSPHPVEETEIERQKVDTHYSRSDRLERDRSAAPREEKV
jgi:hypothetical protein